MATDATYRYLVRVPGVRSGNMIVEGIHRLVDQLPITTSDSKVFDHAGSNDWITITCNRKDFLPLAASGPHPD